MPRILVVNDDSYLSKGLYLLYESVRELGETRIYSTVWPRSGVGHTITFNKPLRLEKTVYMGYEVYVTDGTPIDALHLAIAVHGFNPDVVVSGVNVGENLTLQHVIYSGTLGVAIEAALMGIPSIAFSADVRSHDEFDDPVLVAVVKAVARSIVEWVLEHGLPRGVDLLSVNIPSPRRLRPCVRVACAARRRWKPVYEERLDTRGRPYYWLKTVNLPPEEGTDVYYLEREGCIVVTPLRVDLNARLEGVEGLASLLEERIEKALTST